MVIFNHRSTSISDSPFIGPPVRLQIDLERKAQLQIESTSTMVNEIGDQPTGLHRRQPHKQPLSRVSTPSVTTPPDDSEDAPRWVSASASHRVRVTPKSAYLHWTWAKYTRITSQRPQVQRLCCNPTGRWQRWRQAAGCTHSTRLSDSGWDLPAAHPSNLGVFKHPYPFLFHDAQSLEPHGMKLICRNLFFSRTRPSCIESRPDCSHGVDSFFLWEVC